ncbi:PDZ domain-containing protein [bacterium]|jgi:hypothetical protein|nr:PDZ domain-containing protein [bacterium]
MEDRQKHFERPTTQRPQSLFSLTILAGVIGLLTGAVGYVVVQFSDWSPNASYLNSPELSRVIKFDIDQPMLELSRKYQQSVAGVYRQVAPISKLGNSLFTADDLLGSATVVTSDGWLMSTDQVIKNDTHVIILGDDVYEIEEIKRDDFLNVVFVKIDANFLQPIGFPLTENLRAGEHLFTNSDTPQSIEHLYQADYLAHDHYVTEKFLSTDTLDYYLLLGDQNTAISLAAPYFSANGDVLGLAYELGNEKVLLPAEYLKQSVKHLLSETERVELGLYYIDLENNSGFVRKGHMVYHSQLAPVVYNSTAARANLRMYDQIVAVNSDVVSASRTLTSILQNYRVGDKVILRILRNEVEQDIEIEL